MFNITNALKYINIICSIALKSTTPTASEFDTGTGVSALLHIVRLRDDFLAAQVHTSYLFILCIDDFFFCESTNSFSVINLNLRWLVMKLRRYDINIVCTVCNVLHIQTSCKYNKYIHYNEIMNTNINTLK